MESKDKPTDDVRSRLIKVRDRLSRALNSTKTSPRDLPALSREYRQVLQDLDDLNTEKEVSYAQQLAERRTRRTDTHSADRTDE